MCLCLCFSVSNVVEMDFFFCLCDEQKIILPFNTTFDVSQTGVVVFWSLPRARPLLKVEM